MDKRKEDQYEEILSLKKFKEALAILEISTKKKIAI